MKILITGASGFLGRHLVEFWKTTHTLIGIDAIDTSTQGITSYQIDLCNTVVVEDIISKEKPDFIIHLAAHSTTLSQKDWTAQKALEIIGRNILMTYNVFRVAKSPIIAAGSATEYGGIDNFPNEFLSHSATEPYAISKIISTLMLVSDISQHGTLCLRFANLYGPHQNKGFIHNVIQSMLLGKPIYLTGSGKQYRQWLYIDDAVNAVVQAVDHDTMDKPNFFNIGPKDALSLKNTVTDIYYILHDEIVRQQLRLFPILNIILQEKDGGPKRITMDSTNAKTMLDWQPKISWMDGVRKTVISALEDYYANT